MGCCGCFCSVVSVDSMVVCMFLVVLFRNSSWLLFVLSIWCVCVFMLFISVFVFRLVLWMFDGLLKFLVMMVRVVLCVWGSMGVVVLVLR